MSWMRLTTIPPLRVQPPAGACACWPSAALGRGEPREEVTTETQGPAPPERTWTPAWGSASLLHFRKHHPACPGHHLVKSKWITVFPAASPRRSPNQRTGRNGTWGLEMEGAVLGLHQDGARNDPGMVWHEKHCGRKNSSQACPQDLSWITTQKPCTPIPPLHGTSIGLTEL